MHNTNSSPEVRFLVGCVPRKVHKIVAGRLATVTHSTAVGEINTKPPGRKIDHKLNPSQNGGQPACSFIFHPATFNFSSTYGYMMDSVHFTLDFFHWGKQLEEEKKNTQTHNAQAKLSIVLIVIIQPVLL